MRFVYDGFLSAQTAGFVEDMSRSYGHVVELARLPTDWHTWQEAHLTDYTQACETCMGQAYTRTTKMYALVHNGDRSVFLFLKSQPEKDAVVRAFGELLVSAEPFRTLVTLGPTRPANIPANIPERGPQ
jgi:hypothetical protein